MTGDVLLCKFMPSNSWKWGLEQWRRAK